MPVADIMTKNILTVSPSETVGDMHKIFSEKHLHHLLVVEEGELLGLVSDRDVLSVLSPYLNTKVESKKDQFTLTRRAEQIMRTDPPTIGSSATIQDAGMALLDNKVSLLPVVDDGLLVGVLSWKDVMRFMMD